jgi:hypothetical protein
MQIVEALLTENKYTSAVKLPLREQLRGGLPVFGCGGLIPLC